MGLIDVWFDGDLNIKMGDRLIIHRGILESETVVRATRIENQTTGLKKRSMVDGVMMTQGAENLNPPITGRIKGGIDFRNGNTYFSLDEGDNAKRKPFTPSTKRDELIDSGNRCRLCKKPLKKWGFDFDHKDDDPLNNDPENCQVVCKTCHGIKTVSGMKGK